MNKLLLSCLFTFLFSAIQAQVNHNFLRHLRQERLKLEEITYITSAPLSTDTLDFLKTDYYINYGEDLLFFETFDKIKEQFLKDTNRTLLASSYFLGNEENRNKWFNEIVSDQNNLRITQVFKLYNTIRQGKKIELYELPEPMHSSYHSYSKAQKKSPLLAAGLSAIIPGLGKAYNGKHRRFFASFLTNGMLIYQTYESVNKLGPKHALSITNMIVAGIFYASNIYGSYHDIKLFKHETKNQLFIDASNYYSSEYSID